MREMRAIRVPRFGGPAVLERVHVPVQEPGPGEIRVRVRAAGVNYADLMQREGLYPGGPTPPFIAGFEVAGEIDCLGAGVTQWKVGDRVMALCSGGYAETVIQNARAVFPIPGGLSYREAAAIPCQFLTAYHALITLGGTAPRMTVLIQAAAGGLGTQLVQIAKIRGARVVGTCGSDEKCAFAEGLGCDHAINYRAHDFEAEARGIVEGGFDLIVESVGGQVFDKSLRLLKPRGRMIVLGVASREPRPIPALLLLRNNWTVSGFHLNTYLADRSAMREALDALADWLALGKLRIIQSHTFPLAAAAEAHQAIADRRTTGKVVLDVS